MTTCTSCARKGLKEQLKHTQIWIWEQEMAMAGVSELTWGQVELLAAFLDLMGVLAAKQGPMVRLEVWAMMELVVTLGETDKWPRLLELASGFMDKMVPASRTP